jgi:hypothetical protein
MAETAEDVIKDMGRKKKKTRKTIEGQGGLAYQK